MPANNPWAYLYKNSPQYDPNYQAHLGDMLMGNQPQQAQPSSDVNYNALGPVLGGIARLQNNPAGMAMRMAIGAASRSPIPKAIGGILGRIPGVGSEIQRRLPIFGGQQQQQSTPNPWLGQTG